MAVSRPRPILLTLPTLAKDAYEYIKQIHSTVTIRRWEISVSSPVVTGSDSYCYLGYFTLCLSYERLYSQPRMT
jgi:hypothetical protein